MEKFIELLTKHKILSSIIGMLFFITGILSRGQFINQNMIVGFILPLLFIAVGFGFIFTSVFRKDDTNPIPLFLKSIIAPLAIVITIVVFNKTGVDSPVLRAGTLFLINIAFFNKEIGKALNN